MSLVSDSSPTSAGGQPAAVKPSWFTSAGRQARRGAARVREQQRQDEAAERQKAWIEKKNAEAHAKEAAAAAKDQALRDEAEAASAREEKEWADTVAVETRQHRRRVGNLTQRHAKRVAPLGTPIEQALKKVVDLPGYPASDHWYGEQRYDESFFPVALRLTRKFIRPDEQVLGAVEGRHGARVRFALVVFTHGFGVKTKGREFRSDAFVTFETVTPDRDDAPVAEYEVARFRLGGFDVPATVDSRESMLFPVLAVQRDLQRAPRPRKSRTAKGAGPRPAARLIRTARDAELVAAEWMTHLGFTNVAATPVGADGEVDVTSTEAVAQVKAETIPTGRPKVQQHHGVATSLGKQALFFSLAGFTPQARTYAEANGLVLFSFDLQGAPEPVNPAAHRLMSGQAKPGPSTS
jgi:predicted protein tyrosine phosphatase